MCAINGSTGKDEQLVARMNGVTAHRGPDATRVWSNEQVTLGFNRLAIIDTSLRGMQPMTSHDGRYTIVFNGEIYNYKTLKAELKGYPFVSESDTEVILAGLSKWGDRTLARLNGMFALAIWDNVEGRLLLARDPAGVKPLFYHFDGSRLVFSSELRGVLESGIPRTLNRTAFGHYLRLLYVPQGMTLVEGVSQLTAGELLVYQNNELRSSIFSKGWPEESSLAYHDAVLSVKARVKHAVARQLVADRPVGLFISGGVDSSVILASAAEVHPKINTFSVGFELGEGEESGKFNADATIAARTAQHFGATHHAIQLQARDVASLFTTMVHHMSNPVANATALSQLYLAQKTKDIATVVLAGDGGDELFGGYERYRQALWAKTLAPVIPRSVARLFSNSVRTVHFDGVERYAQLMFQHLDSWLPPLSGLPESETKALFFDVFARNSDIADALMRTDEQNWLIDEALQRADHMSMAASVEVRVPLLDLEVSALLHALPREYKTSLWGTKRVLKDAFKDELPKEVLAQPKRGWFSPGAKWLRRPEFVALADEILSDGYSPASLLFNLSEVRRAFQEHKDKKAYHFTNLWTVLIFLAWSKEYAVTL